MTARARYGILRPLVLLRDEVNAHGTFGTLRLPDGSQIHTMEDDWLWNRRRVSAIAPGDYRLVRTIYHRHNVETFEVVGVPGRSRILIHVANTEEDVEGCIGPGTRRGWLWVPDEDAPGRPMTRKRAVVESRKAFDQFMDAMTGIDEAPFSVRWTAGLP